jgi:cyclopropane-fatty-acyl-phospholipid synthase
MSLLSSPQERAGLATGSGRPDHPSHEPERDGSGPATATRPRPAGAGWRAAILRRLAKIEQGELTIHDRGGIHRFGRPADGLVASVRVRDPRFYRAAALGGSLAAAEAYIRGQWDADDLCGAMRVLSRNPQALAGIESGGARLLKPWRWIANQLYSNTRAGSRKNIAAHYDLSNEFFALMLDRTMTYSSGVFPRPDATLEEASTEKYDRICRKLQLTARDHVLEIGTGWGGFAEHAVRHYGCRVTTTTISEQQYAYAAERLGRAGVQDRVTLLKSDYRDLHGCFDKLVSVEMIEAVGQKYLPVFFRQCCRLLKPSGMMALQTITIPDCRYAMYRRSVDFIQRYIFPGGFLPSVGAISQCVGAATDFRFLHVEDFGSHYAETLLRWQGNIARNLGRIRSLGFDERFLRTWHYYLCYCEAGFRERDIGVCQLLLARPACRREPLLA